MGKRIAYIVVLVVQIAGIAGGFVLDYFAKSRMGMMRWLNYHNRKWEEALPLDAIAWVCVAVAICVVVALAVHVIMRARQKQKPSTWGVCSLVVAVLGVAFYAWFVLGTQVSAARAYYLMSLCFTIAMFLQLGKAAFLLRKK